MKRRQFLAGLAPALVGLGQASRPNILFLFTDDQRYDLMSCAGHPILRTPNIDRIASQGTRFENNFCSTAICCTSRATVLTGLHEKSHRISDFKTPLSPALEALSYPVLLRQAGYRTGFVGKYGVGGDEAPQHLFDKTYGPPGVEAPGQSRKFGQHAIDFLDTAKAGESFYLSLHFRAPHARDPDPQQYLYDPEEAELFRGQTMPISEKAKDRRYFERLPASVKESESYVRWKKRFTNPEHYQESVRSYFRLIAGVDAVVGQVLAKLEAKGLASNTVVVFSSDNGYFLAERGLADKWYAYEESIRTPLLIADGRVPASLRGQRRTEMTLNLDLSPTFLSVAGVTVPAAVQGRNLLPLVRGEKPAWRREWFYSHLFPGFPPKVTIPKSEGLRTERWKYIRWIEEKPAREEVYDLRQDPGELKEVDSARVRTQLAKRWQVWREALEAWTPATRWQDPKPVEVRS
ncbi:MAG: sulfatase [Bryobacter sp.]|nr:sulfatase [Bryobacter sp.]